MFLLEDSNFSNVSKPANIARCATYHQLRSVTSKDFLELRISTNYKTIFTVKSSNNQFCLFEYVVDSKMAS